MRETFQIADDWPTPENWVWRGPLENPRTWGKPGLVMAFNLECAGCIARGVPYLKRLGAEFGDDLQLALLHTAYGHKVHDRADVLPELERFAGNFAQIDMPIALDEQGDLAQRWGAEGTPHWFAFDHTGALVRSVYGSQENAQTRLSYLMAELVESTP